MGHSSLNDCITSLSESTDTTTKPATTTDTTTATTDTTTVTTDTTLVTTNMLKDTTDQCYTNFADWGYLSIKDCILYHVQASSTISPIIVPTDEDATGKFDQNIIISFENFILEECYTYFADWGYVSIKDCILYHVQTSTTTTTTSSTRMTQTTMMTTPKTTESSENTTTLVRPTSSTQPTSNTTELIQNSSTQTNLIIILSIIIGIGAIITIVICATKLNCRIRTLGNARNERLFQQSTPGTLSQQYAESAFNVPSPNKMIVIDNPNYRPGDSINYPTSVLTPSSAPKSTETASKENVSQYRLTHFF